ncbi:MAG: hypothetical protein WBN69_09050 [Eudoraea sp.]
MMKTSKILPIFLLIGFMTYGKEKKKEVKVETIQMGIVQPIDKQRLISRLYKHKNSRTNQALFFMTKKDKPKLI